MEFPFSIVFHGIIITDEGDNETLMGSDENHCKLCQNGKWTIKNRAG